MSVVISLILAVISILIPISFVKAIIVGTLSIKLFILYLISGAASYWAVKEATKNEETEKNFFDKKIGLIILIFWMFPIGLYLLWKRCGNKKINAVISAIIAFFVCFGFMHKDNSEETNEVSRKHNNVENNITTEYTEKTEITSTSTTISVTISSTDDNAKSTSTTLITETTTVTSTTAKTSTSPTTTTVTITNSPTIQPPQTQTPIEPPKIIMSFILNTNTMKAHTPNCRHVYEINDENKQEYTGTSEELESSGYSPCGRCKPW